jgi:hypothetical protein
MHAHMIPANKMIEGVKVYHLAYLKSPTVAATSSKIIINAMTSPFTTFDMTLFSIGGF